MPLITDYRSRITGQAIDLVGIVLYNPFTIAISKIDSINIG